MSLHLSVILFIGGGGCMCGEVGEGVAKGDLCGEWGMYGKGGVLLECILVSFEEISQNSI